MIVSRRISIITHVKVVTFTFDDGLENHLDVVMPAMERRAFRGTFFVNPAAPTFMRRIDSWRDAASRGHELGNHTLFHPARRGKSYITEGNAIENYTLERMRHEMQAANAQLTAIDGKLTRTFAYPCCNTVLGRPGIVKSALAALGLDRTRIMGLVMQHPWLDLGSREKSYVQLANDLFPASRVGGETFSRTPDHYPPPRGEVPCIMLDDKKNEDVDGALSEFDRAGDGWLVFAAHGIGGGHHLACTMDLFEYLLGKIHDHGWMVKTFVDAAELVYGNGKS